jgi:hypothetical protein
MSQTVSPEQLAANRANAANSTGPRTPEGKARSAQNARKHGFTASSFAVVRLEDLNEVAHLKEDLVNLYHPVNSQELFALERVALAQQAILRAARLESGFLSNCLGESFDTNGQSRFPMNQKLTADIEICQAQNLNYLLGDGFYRLVSQNNGFALLLRYQAQAERHYRRAIQEFDRLKALREELRNEPNSAETETNETTSPSCETNPIPPGAPAPPPDPHASVSQALPPRTAPHSRITTCVPEAQAWMPPEHPSTEPTAPPVLSGGTHLISDTTAL